MSEIDDTPTDDELEEKYSDEPDDTYTVRLNETEYALNEEARRRIQQRAKNEYSENPMFSCWWRVADATDAEDESTIHQEGDPILVIETEGPIVPWENLDQLEVEQQTTESFNEFDASDGGGPNSDVAEGNGMKTIKPGEVDPSDGTDDTEEKSRTHFGVTPQDFQEVPSPDGEDPDKIPPKPQSFDEPTLVSWIPDHPEVEHSWSAGEAITPMASWVEWNVQVKADQPRLTEEKPDSHDHWESILQMDECAELGEVESEQGDDILDKVDEGPDSDDDVPEHFKEGKYGGGNWQV